MYCKKRKKEAVHVQEACDTWLSTKNRKKDSRPSPYLSHSSKRKSVPRVFKPANTALFEFNFTQTKIPLATKQTCITKFFQEPDARKLQDTTVLQKFENSREICQENKNIKKIDISKKSVSKISIKKQMEDIGTPDENNQYTLVTKCKNSSIIERQNNHDCEKETEPSESSKYEILLLKQKAVSEKLLGLENSLQNQETNMDDSSSNSVKIQQLFSGPQENSDVALQNTQDDLYSNSNNTYPISKYLQPNSLETDSLSFSLNSEIIILDKEAVFEKYRHIAASNSDEEFDSIL